MKHIKISVKMMIIAAILVAALTLWTNLLVKNAGKSGVYKVNDVPPAEVAIVLGAKVFQDGALSDVLADRMDTGIELYKAGRVHKILVSGDHGQVTYDEVNAMRKYALERGVPEEDIFMDHAGFSTYDTMYRARDVFQVKRAIIVTQDFHLSRALYIARSLGLNASGVASDRRAYVNVEYLYRREWLACPKAVAQVIIGAKPKYLGDTIPVSGDGRVTLDKFSD